MRYFLTFLVATLFITLAEAQTLPHDKNYYHQKGVRQQNTGWIILGTGTIMMVGGAISLSQSEFLEDAWGSSASIMFFGLPVAAISIPFLVSGAKNKGIALGMAGIEAVPTYISVVEKPVFHSGLFVRFTIGNR